MKTALVEWFPRVCGATDWGLHLTAGSDVDRITFSKSGRTLKAWNRNEEWTPHKMADAVAVLNEYDLVILTDVVCFAPQLVKRGREIPYYVDVLNRMKTPWTSMYHGGTYPSKYDDTLRAVLASRSFCGKLITTRLPEAKARLDHLTKKKIGYINHPFLPYDMARAPTTKPAKRRKEILMTARIAVNKGQNAMMYIAPKLHGHLNLWGYNAFGLPSIGWRLWELGIALKYRVKLEAQLRDDAQKLTHPRARRFYTGRWDFAAGSSRVRYHRGYVHLNEIDWSPHVHVSLANDDFKGTLEYVSLDAIAAGAIAVVPEHAIEYAHRQYRGRIVTVPYTRCNIWARGQEAKPGEWKGAIDGNENEMIETLNDLLTANDKSLARRQAEQHACLKELHDPKTVLRKLIKGVSR